MGKRMSNPLPNIEWAQRAYQNAAYMSVSNGNEFDTATGQFATLPRFADQPTPIIGSPGEVFAQLNFGAEFGVHDEPDRLNMIFLMGYMYGQMAGIEKPINQGASNG